MPQPRPELPPPPSDHGDLPCPTEQGFIAGHADCLRAAYDQWGGMLHWIAAQIDAASADEVTAACFVQAWKERAKTPGHPGGLVTWLFGWLGQELDGRVKSSDASPDWASLAVQALLLDSMRKMSGVEYEILSLGLFDGLGVDAIAQRTGQPVSRVRTLLHMGLVRLREGWAVVNDAQSR